jgi:hypothetical protein
MRRDYETATHPTLARRETRFVDSAPNPYDRVTFSGTASGKFQVLRFDGRKFIPTGIYETLAEAIAARDSKTEEQ